MTGWCWNCSEGLILGIDGEVRRCDKCGNAVGDETHSKCWSCRQMEWIEEHVNEIERYMAQGFSFTVSKDLVRIHHTAKARCLRCGDSMKKATNGVSYFCTNRKECRTAQRKLKWQMYHHRVPRERALKIVLDSLDRTYRQEGPIGENNRTTSIMQ